MPPDLTNAVAIAAGGIAGDTYSPPFYAVRADSGLEQWSGNSPSSAITPTNAAGLAADTYGCVALLKDGTLLELNTPYPVPSATNAVAVAYGGFLGLPTYAVLQANGVVIGQNVPSTATNVVALSGGADHFTALRNNGSIISWGKFIGLPHATNCIAVAAGGGFSLALQSDGTVVVWGSGPTNVPSDATNVVAIAAGLSFGMALRQDGIVVAWGASAATNIPPDLPFVTAISAGVSNDVAIAIVEPTVTAQPPTIVTQPFSQTTIPGAAVLLAVKAVGIQPFSYQWFFGTNAIPGATNSTYLFSVQSTAQSGPYSVIVSNAAGPATSKAAIINVLPAFVGIDLVPRLSLQGSLGSNYVIQCINALGPTNAWQTVATVAITNQPQYFYDDSAIGQPQRLYRLLQAP